jgi:hypothetical protein
MGGRSALLARVVDQPVLADLDLVTAGQRRLVDPLTVDVCRPAVVVSESRRKRLPELGPRRTTSRAEPGGSASTAAWSAPESPSDFSAASPVSNPPPLIVMVDVSLPVVAGAGRSAAPQLLQNRASSALL